MVQLGPAALGTKVRGLFADADGATQPPYKAEVHSVITSFTLHSLAPPPPITQSSVSRFRMVDLGWSQNWADFLPLTALIQLKSPFRSFKVTGLAPHKAEVHFVSAEEFCLVKAPVIL